MSVEIGWQEPDVPPIVQALIDATGFSARAKALWERAIQDLAWPVVPPLETLRVAGLSPSTIDPVHEFFSEMSKCIVEDDDDIDNPLTYAVLRGERGMLVVTGPTSYYLATGANRWQIVSTEELEARAVSACTGGASEVVLALDEWACEPADRYPVLGSSPLFASEAAQSFWQDCESIFDDDSEEDMATVPGTGDLQVIVLGSSWDGPHFGPIAPDAHADFHRLRVLAIALAARNYEVTVDFGPFVQDFEEWGSDEYGEAGLISFSAAAPSLAIHSDGRIMFLRLVDCPESDRPAIMQTMRAFGLAER